MAKSRGHKEEPSMRFYGIYVPKNEHWYAKDLSIVIYNIERKRYPKLTNLEYERTLAKRIRKKYKDANGTKTLIEVLKEDLAEVRKKKDK